MSIREPHQELVISHTRAPAPCRRTKEQAESDKFRRQIDEREFDRRLRNQLKEVWE
jgi:hypothetical protein